MPREPRNTDLPVVDVANKFPTVSCDEVAMSEVPSALETIIELGAK